MRSHPGSSLALLVVGALALPLSVGAWAALRPGARAEPSAAALSGPFSPPTAGDAVAVARPVLLPAGVSRDWWSEARREIEAGQAGFAPRPADDVHGWHLQHAGAGLVASFDADGYTLEPRDGSWFFRLKVAAVGREGRMRPVADVTPEASGSRVRFKRGMVGTAAVGAAAVEEWYRNVRGGIEQGFDIAARPEGDGPLVVLQALETTLEYGKAGPWGLTLCRDGAEVFSYRDLKAWDAGGRELKAWMAHGPGELRLVVEDAAAAYPIRIDPLAATPNWTRDGNQDGAEFGYAVASAGDVDGDGYSDVIVGAYLYDNGENAEGRAYVFHGSSTGLSATANWSKEPDSIGAHFGASVASAGDVNGDGYADVIVGADNYTNGEDGEGRAFLFHGSSAGLSASAAWTAESDQSTSNFGISVASAGDVNGDGYADVVVGANRYANVEANEGRAYVYHGSGSGLSAAAVWTVESDQDAARLGLSVASAGDVNGDGYADVAVGTHLYDNGESNEGRAYVYHGSISGLSAAAVWGKESDNGGARFGISVAPAGDVNGDGYDDLVVGAAEYTNGQTDEGRVFVFHGSGAGLSASAVWTAEANQSTAEFGASVAPAGDVNGDGYADVIVGAYSYDNGQANEGRTYVYHGSSTGLSAAAVWTAEAGQNTAQFGTSVASAGDVNGDGFSDVVVGANLYDNDEATEGRAYVFHSTDTTTYNTYNLPGKRRILNPGAGDLLDPGTQRVVRDSNGYWYLAWSHNRSTDIMLSYTTTATPTEATDWATVTLVDSTNGKIPFPDSPPPGLNDLRGSHPAIAISANDTLHFAWCAADISRYFWTNCLAGDLPGGWEKPVEMDNNSSVTASLPDRGIDLAVDRNGYAKGVITDETSVWYSRQDTGSSWSKAVQVAASGCRPRIALDLDENVYVAFHDTAAPYDVFLLASTNAFGTEPESVTWKNLGQTTTDPDTVNTTSTELSAGTSASLVVDMNGICHVAWRTKTSEDVLDISAGLVARVGMINLGWETGPTTLDATVFWKPPVSLTAMGNGDVYLFAVAGSVTGGARRDAVCTIKYTAPTTYRTFGSWDLSGEPVYTETSDLRAGGSQGLWTERLAPRNRTDALWFVANDAQHAMSTSYTDRKTGSAGWRPPAMSSAGFHPHYVYAFPNTDVDLGSMPLPVVSQTALKGAVYMADSSSTGHVYAIDRATGILARSYTLGGTANFITSASYAGNVHLFVHQASNQLLKLTDLGASITFDAAWSNNPRATSTGSIRVPPIFMVEGGTRYLYLTTLANLDVAVKLDKLYADNGNRVAGFPAGSLYASTYTEQTLRALNDQIFIAGGTNKIYRRDADGTGEISSSVIANITKHVFLVRDGNNLFVAPEDNWVWRLTSGLATSTWTSGKSADLTARKTSAAHYTSGTGSIYVGRTNVLYRLNATDGTEISSWAQPTAGNIVTPPVLWSTYVYFGTDTGELFAVDQATNVARANWPITLDSTNGVPVVRTIAFDGSFGHVYFSTDEGRVYKFSLE